MSSTVDVENRPFPELPDWALILLHGRHSPSFFRSSDSSLIAKHPQSTQFSGNFAHLAAPANGETLTRSNRSRSTYCRVQARQIPVAGHRTLTTVSRTLQRAV